MHWFHHINHQHFPTMLLADSVFFQILFVKQWRYSLDRLRLPVCVQECWGPVTRSVSSTTWGYWGRGGQPGSTSCRLVHYTTGIQYGKKCRNLLMCVWMLMWAGGGILNQSNWKSRLSFQGGWEIQRQIQGQGQRLLGVVWRLTEILRFLSSWRGNKAGPTTGWLSLHRETQRAGGGGGGGGAGGWEEYLQSDQTMDLSPQPPPDWAPG